VFARLGNPSSAERIIDKLKRLSIDIPQKLKNRGADVSFKGKRGIVRRGKCFSY
jgi:hypothetical protein